MTKNYCLRLMDELGRVVIPRELRVAYSLKPGDEVRITQTEEGILITKEERIYENDKQ